MARDWNRQARYGRMLPFVITYGAAAGAGARAKWPLVGQLTVSGITYGSARWAVRSEILSTNFVWSRRRGAWRFKRNNYLRRGLHTA